VSLFKEVICTMVHGDTVGAIAEFHILPYVSLKLLCST
jgi:hypothetical protein